MVQTTRFASRSDGPTDRVRGFVDHLRLNGARLGVQDTEAALAGLAQVAAADPGEARLALRVLLTGNRDRWDRFDALFDAYWFRHSCGVRDDQPASPSRRTARRPGLWSTHLEGGSGDEAEGGAGADADASAEDDEGRLIAQRQEVTARRDFRELLDPETLAEAERIARRLALAIRDRRSRRRRGSRRGSELDLRAIARASLARGGEPIDLKRKRRIDRPLRLLAILDVSGSMQPYARAFLAFLKGLVTADDRADAFLLHTSLVRVGGALRDPDPLRAATRLALMQRGFGGGTQIGACLAAFNERYARTTVDGRTIVVILSDGYDTGAPERMGQELGRLQKRARRVVWLNPLLGWKDYAPVAAGMAAALPHLDAFRPANTLVALADLEPLFARL